MRDVSPKTIWIWLLLVLGIGSIGIGAAWWIYAEEVAKRQASVKRGEVPPKYERGLPVYGDVADFGFENFDGRRITRETLLGKVWVVDFIFTTCTGLCPVMTGSMRQVQERTKDDPAFAPAEFRLMSITTDPEVDTRETLKAYADKFGADPARWHIVRGPFDEVQRFSQNALKLGLERATAGQVEAGSEKIIHSNKFVLIDRTGKIRGIYSGTDDKEVDELVRDIPKLLQPSKESDRGRRE